MKFKSMCYCIPIKILELSHTCDYDILYTIEPIMWDLISIVIPIVKACWVKLAYSMGYEISNVRGFEGDGKDLEERCQKLFEDWLTTDHGCTPKTWEKLLERIKAIDELKAAAEEIEEKLKS